MIALYLPEGNRRNARSLAEVPQGGEEKNRESDAKAARCRVGSGMLDR
ncbi:hypothetical protein [Micromonospora purpureochromogenes]|nr:hypothetical protein [Micromonospora purpureochromogenes]